MTVATAVEPLLLELDEKTYAEQLDRVESWFGNVLMAQATYRKLAEDTADEIHEPHVREYLRELAAKAKEHEGKAEELYRLIGREPSGARKLGGAARAKGGEWMAALEGLMGGARGNWKGLRALLLACVDARGAFAVAEQLGYAMGIPAVAELAFAVVMEQSTQMLLIQEYLLEMGPISILMSKDV
jgi:hypothetical protein